MVTHESATVFGAIVDPTRREILDALRGGERSAGEIAARFPVSRPAISRHLRVLREAGLVVERRDSRNRFYAIDPRPLREVDRWLEHYRVFWTARLLDLKRHVEATHHAPPRSGR